jgi:hypothetical protein
VSIALAIRNRLAVCALVLMLVPHWISVPTFVRAARAEESVQFGTARVVDVTAGGRPLDQSAAVRGLGDVPAFRSVGAEDYARTVSPVSREPTYGALHHGGTVGFYNALWDLRPSDGRADPPYQRP